MSSPCQTIQYDASQIFNCEGVSYYEEEYRVYIPVIPKSQWQGPRCVLFCAPTAVYCILASVLLRVYLPWSLPPSLSPFLPRSSLSLLPRSVAPSFLRSLPPSSLSFAPSMPTFLPHSFPSSTFPPFLHSRSLPPSHPPSCLAPSVPPSLHVCLPPPSNSMYTVCGVWPAALSLLCRA